MRDIGFNYVAVRYKKIVHKAFGGSASNVFKGMKTLALGSGIAKVIGIAAIPILTRLYSPEDFGVLAIFTAIITMLSPVITLRYVLALPLPRHDGMAFNLLILSTGLMLITCLIVNMLLWKFGEIILPVLSMEVLIPWWWLISLGLLTAVIYEMLTLWATRKRDYRSIAKTNVWQSLLGSFTKIILGVIGLNPFGLLIGQVMTQGGGSGSLLKIYSKDFKKNWRYLRWSRMRKIAWVHRGFPIYRVPSQFLMLLAVQAPLLFMAAMYDANTTGQLGLALMALGLPLKLFGNTLAKAFYAEAANLGSKEANKIRIMLIAIVKRLAIFAIPPTLILLFFGTEIFMLSFGEEWRLAGTFSTILAIYLFFQFIQTPVAHVFYIFEGQKQLLLINLQRMGLVFVCFGISYKLDLGSESAILIYAFTLSVHYILSSVYAFRFIPIK
jgi:O-antigen/teichoic acid export membrane protein